MPLLTSAVLTAGLKMAAPTLIATGLGAMTGGGGGQRQPQPSPQQMAGMNAMHNMSGGGGGGPAGLLGGIATQMLPGLLSGLMGGKRR